MENEKIIIVQTDAGKMESSLNNLSAGIGALKMAIGDVNKAVSHGFQTNHGALRGIAINIGDVSKAVTQAAGSVVAGIKSAADGIGIKLSVISGTLDDVKKQLDESGTFDMLNRVREALTSKGKDCCPCQQTKPLGDLGDLLDGGKDHSGGQLALPAPSEPLALPAPGELLALPPGNSNDGMLDDLVEIIDNNSAMLADDGVVDGIIPDGTGLLNGGIADAFDDIAAKLKNSAAATWLQNAATTAWQGISTAATAVTTAFGAAMNFLTSPIGLVVIGITALIAIIVLLIANWDTVKTAVLTAWEAIKNAVTVAVDWISTKIQEGFAFIQNIFAGVNEFLQGVFAKDWTEQFGAFGNVLNAFFTNVENVWNAVCFLKFCEWQQDFRKLIA